MLNYQALILYVDLSRNYHVITNIYPDSSQSSMLLDVLKAVYTASSPHSTINDHVPGIVGRALRHYAPLVSVRKYGNGNIKQKWKAYLVIEKI